MTFRHLLVHLDHSSGCVNRLHVALGLADRLQAQVTGIFVVPDYTVPAYVAAQIPIEITSDITEQAIERAKLKVSECQEIAMQADIQMKSTVEEGLLASVLREHSKYADLLILGQDQPDDPDNTSYGLADTLLVEGATACLVVPHSGPVTTPGKRILVAWNASRESARAVRETLPLLQQAESVVVLVSEPDHGSLAPGIPHAAQIARYLSLHGIESEFSRMNEMSISPAEALTTQAADMNADLIVMGAYGHTRFREIILGGTTRHMLKEAPLPLLLAH